MIKKREDICPYCHWYVPKEGHRRDCPRKTQETAMSKKPKIVSEPKIEKNIPVPSLNQNREGVYYETWHKLKPGDSLFYGPESGEDMENLIWRIRARKNNFKRAHPHLNWKIVTRAVGGGIRIWRIK